jgi:hypothetical protein
LAIETDSHILHRQAYMIALVSFGSDPQMPRTIFDIAHRVRCVPEQVHNDLLKLHTVACNKREVAGKFGAQNHTVSLKFTQRQGNPLQMVVTLIRINDMNRLVATLEAVLYEGKQHTILFVGAIEKRADMTCFAELGAGQGNGRSDPLHPVFLQLDLLNVEFLQTREQAPWPFFRGSTPWYEDAPFQGRRSIVLWYRFADVNTSLACAGVDAINLPTERYRSIPSSNRFVSKSLA